MTDESPLHDTHIEELAPQPTIVARVQQPMAELDLAAVFDRYPAAIREAVEAAGGRIVGPPFGRYHRFGPDIVDVEVGHPVDAAPLSIPAVEDVAPGVIGRSELPGGLVARTIHRGPYSRLSATFDALHAWIHEQPDVDDGAGPWESYLDRPDQVTDTAQLRTEIVWPLTRAG